MDFQTTTNMSACLCTALYSTPDCPIHRHWFNRTFREEREKQSIANVCIELAPLPVAYWAVEKSRPGRRQDGPFQLQQRHPMHLLPDDTIRRLIEEFADNVWAEVHKARAEMPREPRKLEVAATLPPGAEAAWSPNDFESLYQIASDQ